MRVILLCLCLMLAGCWNTKEQVEPPRDTLVHPAYPSPVQPYTFNWVVVPLEKEVIVGLEYNQSLEFRLFLEDMKRYIREQNEMLCFYRHEIEDPRCK